MVSQQSFTVVYQTVAPSPSWSASKHRTRGTLAVSGDHAIFHPKSGENDDPHRLGSSAESGTSGVARERQAGSALGVFAPAANRRSNQGNRPFAVITEADGRIALRRV